MLSTPGIGSGLDISGIIDQLMTVERQPLVKLGTQQVEMQARLSAYGKLKSTFSVFQSAVDSLSDADKFRYHKASSSDDAVLSASADASAARGRYNIDVVRVAENHRLAAGTTFADTTSTQVGSAGDKLTLTVGDKSFTVDYGEKTLEQVRDAINGAADNTGVTASILKADDGYHLTLAANATGSDNFVSLAYSAGDPFSFTALNGDRNGADGFTATDLDAVITMEGSFTATSSSNTVSDVIAGVSLNLEKAGSVTVDVERDTAKIRGSVNQFIGAYNEVIGTLTKMRGEVLSDERSSLLSVESQLRGVLNTKAGDSATFDLLFELGVETQLDGTLALNATTFDKALAKDPEGIADMFANADSGLATRFASMAKNLTGAGGLFDSRETSLNARIREAETARASLEARLTRKEESLVDQFSKLDALLASLTTTSNYLSTQLDQIAAVSKSSNGG